MLTVENLSRSANSFRSDGDTVSARKREEALAEKKERRDEKEREQEARAEVEERECSRSKACLDAPVRLKATTTQSQQLKERADEKQRQKD
jgi:hypothetical protein